MRPQAICLLFACLLLAATAGAQEIMSVNIQNRCVFTGSVMEEELYRFEQNNRVSEWVQEILDRSFANSRLYPSIDLTKSSTRREDLLLDKDTLQTHVHSAQPPRRHEAGRGHVVHEKTHDAHQQQR